MISLILLATLNSAPITVEFHGTLREALREVAHKGGLNLIATGDLDADAEVYLKDVTAEEALASVAKAYDLEVKHEGKLWVVKPASDAVVAPMPPMPPMKPLAPLPPVPPLKLVTPIVDSDEAETEAEKLRDHAEKLRDEAEALREKAEELRDAKQEEIEAAKDQARAKIEVAKAHGESKNDRVSMNGPVTVAAGERVDSAISYGGPVTIERDARVDGDVVSFGGDVILQENSRVDGDAVSFGGKVIKAEGARVRGEDVSFGGSGLGSVMASKAVQAAAHPHLESNAQREGSRVAAFFAQFAVLFGVGFLLMMFAPNRMKTVEAEMQLAPVKNGVAGLLAMLCSLPLTLFLVITLFGIPVAMAFWMLAGFCTLVGLVAVANLIGARVPVARLRRTQAVALAVGLVSMLLVARIPVVGPLLMSGAIFVSLGAIIRTRLGRGQGMPISTGTFIDSMPVG